jgi:hypothetical protein
MSTRATLLLTVCSAAALVCCSSKPASRPGQQAPANKPQQRRSQGTPLAAGLKQIPKLLTNCAKPTKTCSQSPLQAKLQAPPVRVELKSGAVAQRASFKITGRQECNNTTDRWFWIWWVSHEAGRALSQLITPMPARNVWHRPVVFLGRDALGDWYAQASPMVWIPIQETFALQGGEDPMKAALLGLDDNDCGSTRRWSLSYVVRAEKKALAGADRLIESKHPGRIRMLHLIKAVPSREVTTWLMRHAASSDKDVARKAAETLIHYPRPEAMAFYLRRMKQQTGTADLTWFFRAFNELKTNKADRAARRVLDRPFSLHEYRLALEYLRRFAASSSKKTRAEQKALSQAGVRVFDAICYRNSDSRQKIKSGIERLARTADVDYAVVLALDLALVRSFRHAENPKSCRATRLFSGFGGFHPKINRLPYGKLDWVGMKILRRLPRKRVLEIVEHLAKTCTHCGCIKRTASRLAASAGRR